MKARVKATGNIVDVKWYGHNSMGAIYADVTQTATFYEYELDFDTVYDYWERLEHQYAGMAMQGILSCPEWNIVPREGVFHAQECALQAQEFAHALVEKLKEKEE